MVFSGIPFLFYFLPCVLAVYFAVPKRAKNAALLVSSLLFYGWGEPKRIVIMAAVVLQGFFAGLLLERLHGKRKKAVLIGSVSISLGCLGYFKYAGFFLESLGAAAGIAVPALRMTLPIGISFYTFQVISYTADVYRGSAAAQHFLTDLAMYITMFPQLIAGPIVRYTQIEGQLKDRKSTFAGCALGTRRFAFGLAKKVLIANSLGELCSIFKASGDQSVLFFWLYAAAYTLHIYFDFSGYSDMAIGLGRVLGFSFPENFDHPYCAGSVTGFWRRWHMTLGSWFRDYVYIPMGGNRVSRAKHIRNILVVWMLTGLWHGAAWTFVLWGCYYAVLLILEKQTKLTERLAKVPGLRHVYLLLVTMIGFVIFDAADLPAAWRTLLAMFGAGGYPLVSVSAVYYLRSYLILLLLAALFSTPLPGLIVKRICSSEKGKKLCNALEPFVLLGLLFLASAYLAGGAFNPFLYFRF